MPVQGNPNRSKCEAALRKLGRPPSYQEMRKLAEQFKADPATVYRWARKLYPAMGRKAPSTAPAPTPSVSGAAATPAASSQALGDMEVAYKPVEEQRMPRFVTGDSTPPAEEQAQAAPPEPAPPAIVMLDVKPVVQTVAVMFNARIPGELPFPDAPPPIAPISEQEVELLSDAIAPVVQKYAPMLTKYAVEINCAAIAAVIIVPRVIQGVAYAKYVNAKNHETESRRRQSPKESAPEPQPVNDSTPSGAPKDDGRARDYTHMGDAFVKNLREPSAKTE